MNFIWNPEKDAMNRAKHGVSFETAKLVFDDPYHLSVQDRIVEGEKRWRTMGAQPAAWSFSSSLIPTLNATAMKQSGSFRPDGQRNGRESIMKKESIEEVKAWAAMDDKDIDTSDIPETDDWSSAERGRFYRPVKQKLTIRLDADVIAWFKRRSPHYQTAINKALREYMQRPEL